MDANLIDPEEQNVPDQIHEALQDVPINRAEPPVDDQEQEQQDGEGANDEGNWNNPLEWDRAAEDLTWERLLGLDGSLVFLEHVFWVVSLNTLFIFFFAFIPFCIGNFSISLMGIKPLHFHGLLNTLIGYCIVGIFLVQLHALAKLFKLKKPRRIIGLCYIGKTFCNLNLTSIKASFQYF